MTTSQRLEAGQPAPTFSLPNQDGKTVSLSDLAGRRVILFFYPEAMTPGCTTQACDFRDNEASLLAAGFTVIGISRDAPSKQTAFRERDSLPFDLLSDEDKAVHLAYGAWGEKNSYGKTVTGVLRSTFVIAPDGTLEQALYNVKATGHVAMLRKKLGLD
ncbi:peroxiredoxin Q/BCP [Labedella gwakjiensis]|uniref:thioredoxin-dependent peroxiredoxin n=1 Tax=Labedella gwakjiensis TaxID=390269 RepID=A0A2P8GY08_9MICO|nr:thioredoxin-dependent thiol peroxidase [Labedella gwakjiensis]PSL38842.1 peroxiredoxin Q/BCP [Labedella gwakjiensis]RUQ86689.1 thioredoxin-dependent thiol peroxidase [Labedella gwakjiensis]